MSRNYGNGMVPMVARQDGMERCTRCGTGIVWLRTARRRIPFHSEFGHYLSDHRDICRINVRRLNHTAFLLRLGSSWQGSEAQEGTTAGPSRDESVAHVPAIQAGGQTTRRAAAQATPPPSTRWVN